MKITVYDLLELALESYYKCAIWDLQKCGEVFSGTLMDVLFSDYAEKIVCSFDIDDTGKLTINIDDDDDDD